MKKIILCLFISMFSLFLFSCDNNEKEEESIITYPIITELADGTKSYNWGETKPLILTLGDSIASGYALETTKKRYSTLFSSLTNTKEENKAVAGYDSTDLLNQLEKMTTDERNVIFLSIGANNILGVVSAKFTYFNNIISGAFASKNKLTINTTLASIQTYLDSKEVVDAFNAGIDRYKDELPKIIDKMHEMWPNTPILIQTIYNPFIGFKYEDKLDLEASSEKYILKINEIIKDNVNKYDFLYLVDVHDAFINGLDDYINASFNQDSSFNFDPHPNELGHQLICDTYFKVWSNLNYIRSEN